MVATVKVTYEETGSDELYKLIDTEDGHVWLEFGTHNTDDYYPSFVFNYTPKPNE